MATSRPTLFARAGAALDRVVGVVSPERGLARRQARQALERSEQLQAAKTFNANYSWLTPTGNVNTLIGNSMPTVRRRVYQLVNDFPVFRGASENLVNFIVGAGFTFQSRVMLDDERPDIATRRAIEDLLWRYSDPHECDLGERCDLGALQQLAIRQDLANGEYLATWEPAPGRLLPLAMNCVEPYRLAESSLALGTSGPAIEQGIEYDRRTGAAIAYLIEDEADFAARTVRYPAALVQHNFRVERPGQMRGISAFAPAVLLAHYMGEMLMNEVEAGAMQSKWLAFVETPTPELAQQMRGAAMDATGKKIESLANGIIEYLRPGEKPHFQAPTRPSGLLDPFTQVAGRLIAIALQMPYELVVGDYRGLNYTTIRGSRNDFLQALRPRWARHEIHFCRPFLRRVLDMAVLTGRLRLKNYWADPHHYLEGLWIPPGMPPVDPLREVKAAIEKISAGLGAPQDYIMASGKDPEEVVAQIAEWKAIIEAKGLTWGDVLGGGTAGNLKTNPAAIEAELDSDKAARIRDRLRDLRVQYDLTTNDLRLFLGELAEDPDEEELAHAS